MNNQKESFQNYLHKQNKIELICYTFLCVFPFSWLLFSSIYYKSTIGIINSLLICLIISIPFRIRYFKHNKMIKNENFIIEKVIIEDIKFSLLEKTLKVKFSNKDKYKNMPIYEDWRNNNFAYYIKLGKTEYYLTKNSLK